MYQLTDTAAVVRLEDGAHIPADVRNLDFVAYQRWLDGGNTPLPYQAPPTPVPQVVSAFQARAALLGAGLLDDVTVLMARVDTPRAHRLAWEYGTEVRRQSPLTIGMGAALGLDDAELDKLFIAAAQIQA